MAKRKTFDVQGEAPEVMDTVDQVDNVDADPLEVIPGTEAMVEADGLLPNNVREVVHVVVTVPKPMAPFAQGDCIGVVTLPDGMTLDRFVYAIRHGYAGPRA